ncbi:M23 family metallopeptidase [Nocardioides sp. KIGAM211]|uniref:M23 family metallopeptidase n=1 Tax=Nocardioides luti TaxID=2761101 RepID=A0A7X0VD25_9ACTN|nr:M23 family metallopeptidase [Nocardioides luti]MBB6628858.1 M23 family metallopeptidase [Nocardioides luti]
MGNHRADRRGHGRAPSETPDVAAATAGKRRAAKHTASRGPLFRGLPSAPILLGVAALAVSAGGAVTAASPDLASNDHRLSQASALSGASDVSTVSLLDARKSTVSRDSRRDALADAANAELVDEAENQAEQRNAALAKFAQQAEVQAKKIALNAWVLPVEGYHLTATFGEYSGLWSHFHTGLDFAAPSGTPIHAVANGVVTSVGYDGSYGNKTVITLEDGTELWFCHQTSYAVSTGQVVRAGELIGYVGSTGNVTGPHLHLEVRPGGGDPVDPYQALVVHGLNP